MELLGQGAQALKDDKLLELTSRCHPQTLRQMRWANAVLKERTPQALTPSTAAVQRQPRRPMEDGQRSHSGREDH
jgi:hypothetical protein